MDTAAEGQGLPEDGHVAPPEPTLTVAAVARRMGVAPPTLRTWDRRYGLGPSAHTAGAHRRYSSADVARLLVMRRLTLEGVSPADAAKIAKATPVHLDHGVAPYPDPVGSEPDGPDGRFGEAAEEQSGSGARGPADRALKGLPVLPEPAPSDTRIVVDAAAEVMSGFRRPDGSPAGPVGVPRPGPGPDAEREQSRDRSARGDRFEQYSRDDRYEQDQRDQQEDDEDTLELSWADEPGEFDEPEWLGVLRDAGDARGSAGGGRVVALPYATPQSRGLARAAMSLDTFEMSRLLRDALRREGTVTTWTTMIMPVLRALGERTQVTGDGIDVEHAFSEVVLGVLRGVVLNMQQPRNTSPVLLACADGDYHSLPLHALAAALSERQVSCRMLGSGLPPHALAASVRRTGPSVIVLFARMGGADAGPTQLLRRQRPAPTIVLAGPGWESSTIPPFARCAASLTEAIDEVLLGVHL